MSDLELKLQINGFEVRARYSDGEIAGACLPLLRALTERREALGRRLVAFLAAPPAAGKSTLAAFLQRLSRDTPGVAPLQALGMDGFHYPQAYLDVHSIVRDGAEIPLRSIKGAPETFDLEKLSRALERARTEDVRWPVYDRRLHDPVEDALPVTGEILLVEGNWLLLDEPGWRELDCDYSAFIAADESLLRGRLVERKARGGLSRREAEAWYDASDGPNVRRCMARRRRADLELRLDAEGRLRPNEAKTE